MRAAVIVMVVLVLGLAALTYARGGVTLVGQGLRAGGTGMLQLLPMLAVVFLLTGFVEVLISRETIVRWFSDESGSRGLLTAWLAGAITPGGGPIGLPIAAALMRAGASISVLVTYLASVSLLSFVRIPMEIGIYGLRLTLFRVASSALLPLLAGLIARGLEQALKAGSG